jgi:spermidine synthase
MIVYVTSAYTIYNGLIIYGLSIAIGSLIGLEIPLVTRLNDEYETLRVNISSVMENDYYGSLIGGIFFAFVGLPYLGLTYTPFVLGAVNLSVAMLLYFKLRHLIKRHYQIFLNTMLIVVICLIGLGFWFAKPIILFGEQKRYKDQVIFETQSKYQKIVITQWKNEFWLFINGSQQISTLDEVMYHEPLVHPIMKLAQNPQNVLVMGGGDGCAVRDILKHKSVKQITVVDLDPAMTELAKTHPVLLKANEKSFLNTKVQIINRDAFKFMTDTKQYYDVMIIDLPDPKTIELNRLYSREFYLLCYQHLRPDGYVITQSGSPYYATKAFICIKNTMEAAGFAVTQMHNQVLTLGEWGWTIGSKQSNEKDLKKHLKNLQFNDIKTQWINNEAMQLMTSFGKETFFLTEKVAINTIHEPVLYKYYLAGNWDLY